MANSTYTDFLKDPDQQSRRAELETFFGPNAGKFMKAYDAQRTMVTRAPGEKVKFSFSKVNFAWPPFFIGPVWFFYRKMWAWGIGLTVLIIVLALLPIGGRIGLPLGIGMAAAGSLAYLSHAVKTIERMRKESPTGLVSTQQLAQAGGVSKAAGWIGGVLYAILVLISIYGFVLLARSGTPIR